MHEFKYVGNNFYCEGVNIRRLAEKYGTPLYVYSYHTLLGHFLKLKDAFRQIDPLICYSVKANSNLAILKALVDKGAGLDIVSGGELERALSAGCPAGRIVYASVGKTAQEINEAIKKGIFFFNVESLPELEEINRIAEKLNKVVNVAIRINPDVEPKTHKYITTGKLTNKFGIDFKSARQIFLMRRAFRHLDISGIHIHIGSQITEPSPYLAALKKVIDFIALLEARGIGLKCLNIGGGLGIVYDRESPQTAQEFSKRVLPLLKKTGLEIIMEPGRFIVGNAGILVAKVLYVKKTPLKKFVIIDAAMNDLIRPALYGSYHNILPLRRAGNKEPAVDKVDIVGPICESGDFLAKGRLTPALKAGDYIAVMGAGAYGFSMSSNYNSRCRAAEVLVVKNEAFQVRRREDFEDIIRNEHIPPFLMGL